MSISFEKQSSDLESLFSDFKGETSITVRLSNGTTFNCNGFISDKAEVDPNTGEPVTISQGEKLLYTSDRFIVKGAVITYGGLEYFVSDMGEDEGVLIYALRRNT